MAAAAGKLNTKGPSLPSGFVYDLPSFERPPHSAPSSAPYVISPRGSPASNTNPTPGNSSDFQILNLQIEKQQLEIRLVELEILISPFKLSLLLTFKLKLVASADF